MGEIITCGVDVGGTFTKAGLFRGETLAARLQIPTTRDKPGEVIDVVDRAVSALLSREQVERADLHGVGVALACPVREDGSCEDSVRFPLSGIDVKESLSARFGVPVRCINDAPAAALGEHWQGAGRTSENFVMLTIGTGFGYGALVDGKPLYGLHGAAGEVGDIPAALIQGPSPLFSGAELLEDIVSATGLVSCTRAAFAQAGRNDVAAKNPFSAQEVISLVEKGDAIAREAYEAWIDAFARALPLVISPIDPELVIIGGGVSRAGETLLEPLRRAYGKRAYPKITDTPLVLAQLGGDGGMYGAAFLAGAVRP